MTTYKQIIYYGVAGSIFVILKLLYPFANNNNLIFLMKPVNKIVELVFNSQSVFEKNSGYIHSHLNIVINKSCSGFNFGVLCFLMCSVYAIYSLKRDHDKILIIPILLIAAYILTIIANSSRILISIIGQNIANNILFAQPHHLIHEAIGSTVYLFFLIIGYVAVRTIIR